MNHITNQSNEVIIASGSDDSFIRIFEQYNITVPKIMHLMRFHKEHGTLIELRQCVDILKSDKVSECKWQMLINTARYYFTQEVKELSFK